MVQFLVLWNHWIHPGRVSLAHQDPHIKPHLLAQIITNSAHCLASQHIPGDHNTVSGLLSFAGDVHGYQHPLAPDFPTNAILTQRFHSHKPQLIPKGFQISPLPNKGCRFLMQALQTIKSSWIQSKRKSTRKRTTSGANGRPSVLKPN
jgi:hypothetical protein